MKKLGVMMAAALLFLGAATYAQTAPQPAKAEVKKEAPAKKSQKAKKGHHKHHSAKKAAASQSK